MFHQVGSQEFSALLLRDRSKCPTSENPCLLQTVPAPLLMEVTGTLHKLSTNLVPAHPLGDSAI